MTHSSTDHGPENHSGVLSEKVYSGSSRGRNRSVDDYLGYMANDVRSSLDQYQMSEVKRLLAIAIPKPSPKIVDLRFTVDLILSRFYVVLFVGKDRRGRQRQYRANALTRIGNFVAAAFLLVSLNLLISLFIFMLAYLMKSAVGIDLFPGEHLVDQVEKF
ncbi:MAG: hypothetical protein ACFB5Z_11115 [Elainellaceae cyanobacterium]